MNKPTVGQTLQKEVNITFRKLDEHGVHAVYAIDIAHPSWTENWYAFLVSEQGRWKLSAIRQLALTEPIFAVAETLRDKPNRTESEEWNYQNTLLLLKSDQELKIYLTDHLEEFNAIKDAYLKGDKTIADKTARTLFVSLRDTVNELIDLTLGGTIDNTAGYLYLPEGKSPPEMNPANYIYVEQITGNWYIYKTT